MSAALTCCMPGDQESFAEERTACVRMPSKSCWGPRFRWSAFGRVRSAALHLIGAGSCVAAMTTSRRREPTVEVVGQDGLVLSVTPIDAPKPD